MAYRVQITYAIAATDTLGVNPVYSPSFSYTYDENSEPPVIVSMDETWTLDGRIKGPDAAATWDTLLAKLTSTSDPPTGILIQRDTGGGFATFHELSTTTRERFRIEAVENPNTGNQGEWASHVKFTLRAIGRTKTPSSTAIRAELSFSYDDAGLATRTWRGTVQTVTGTSAQAAARTLGFLALPGATWTAASFGPEGLNVRVLDGDRDTEAEWEGVAQEHGESAPGSVGSFKHRTETTTEADDDGTIRTTTRIVGEAAGAGALSYVNSLEPSGWLSKRLVNDIEARRAAVEFVVEDVDSSGTSRGDEANVKRTFRVQGDEFGGITMFPLTGEQPPIIQRGGLVGFTITETIEVRATSVSGIDSVPIPGIVEILDGYQDGPSRDDGVIELEARGSTQGQDRYVRRVTRVFKWNLVNLEALLVVLADSIIALGARTATGKDGGGAITLGFGGVAGSLGSGVGGRLSNGFSNVKIKIDNVF